MIPAAAPTDKSRLNSRRVRFIGVPWLKNWRSPVSNKFGMWRRAVPKEIHICVILWQGNVVVASPIPA